jgi:hypothetical protein
MFEAAIRALIAICLSVAAVTPAFVALALLIVWVLGQIGIALPLGGWIP